MHNNGISFVCFGVLHPNQEFFAHVRTISCLPGLNQYLKQGIKCLAQEHNTLTPLVVSLKLAALQT